MRGSAVRNYYNSNSSIIYIMVIAKIGNPIIPDTSDASRRANVDSRTIVIRLWLIGWTHSTKEHRRQPACVL